MTMSSSDLRGSPHAATEPLQNGKVSPTPLNNPSKAIIIPRPHAKCRTLVSEPDRGAEI